MVFKLYTIHFERYILKWCNVAQFDADQNCHLGTKKSKLMSTYPTFSIRVLMKDISSNKNWNFHKG